MSRPKREIPLVSKVAQAFRSVGKLQRAGVNKRRNYRFTRATDVLEAVRDKLLSQDVLILIREDKPEYVAAGVTNGGEQLTECRLSVTYTFKDVKEELPPMTVNGAGRDVEEKSIYKAQTGAQKALLKRFGLIAEEVDDPEFDASRETGESLDDIAPLRAQAKKTVTPRQIEAFFEACTATGKTADEIAGYLLTTHKVAIINELGRGKAFSEAIVWASDGKGTLAPSAPKPQAVPDQGKLPLRTAAAPIEMKIGSKTVSFQPNPDRATFSV